MAKKSMRPEVRAAKLRNNKLDRVKLVCHTDNCDNEFYVATASKVRKCLPCFTNPPQVVAAQTKKEKSVLFKLGLIF